MQISVPGGDSTLLYPLMRLEIPPDVWRCIAGFLPAEILVKLFSVNRTFLQIATETRYRAIDFVAYDTAKPLMRHVKGSALVHSVRVQPWVVKPKEPKHSLAWRLIHSCVAPTEAFDDDAESQVVRRLAKQTTRVADIIKGLPNLHTYHIDWDEGPRRKEFFKSLLYVIPSIGKNLHTLVLKVPMRYTDILPGLVPQLPYLESLALTIHTGSLVPNSIIHQFAGLAVFINRLLHNLRSLSIHTTPTSRYLDLGPLLIQLGHGRRLTSFTLCIPFDGGHLTNPSTLRRFLFRHCSKLESLTLCTMRAAAHATPGPSTAKFWIRDTMKNHPSFPTLSHLALGLRPLRTDLGPLERCLEGIHSHLQVLKLSERPLEYAELAGVLAALGDAPLLRVLALRLRWLSPEVVDLIAASLPALRTLELNFTEVVHREPTNDTSSARSDESCGLTRQGEVILFCQAMGGRQYSNWDLTRLAAPESPRDEWLGAIERAFVGCIPGLTCFEELVVAG